MTWLNTASDHKRLHASVPRPLGSPMKISGADNTRRPVVEVCNCLQKTVASPISIFWFYFHAKYASSEVASPGPATVYGCFDTL